jgi:Flp pilus assembly protein TadB
MGWLLFAALGMIWVAFLFPARRRSPDRSVEDFERNMEILASTDGNDRGRWIVTPRKGMAFVGPRERARERARQRRRRVFVFMLESLALTFLIGLVPPLRAMWYATAALLVLLGVYVWLLVWMKGQGARTESAVRAREAAEPERPRAVRTRYAADAASRTPRPAFNGLATLGADELVSVVVKPARQVGVARV